MNQGRIWCVVHPTVGLPLFLGSVALTSLAVHTAVMTHTTWMSSYWAGSTRNKTAMETTTPKLAATDPTSKSAFSMTVTPVPATAANGQASFVITVSPNATPVVKTVDDKTAEPTTAVPVRSARAG
jgi:light-harvesting protein B-800-850 alpha chain